MTETDALLTVRQLQDLLQVDRITIYRMLRDGRLDGFKVGRQWRFSRDVIENWLQEHQVMQDVGEARPTDTGSGLPTSRFFPVSCIQSIQGVFAEALQVAAVTTSVDGVPLTAISNSCDFCNLILKTRVGEGRCVRSWRAAARGPSRGGSLDTGNAPRIATCHAGLRYVWGLVEVRGSFIAAIHAGQFLDDPPNGGDVPSHFTELSNATGLSLDELRDALTRVPVLDADHQARIRRLLQRVAGVLAQIGEERLDLVGRLQRIAEISQIGSIQGGMK